MGQIISLSIDVTKVTKTRLYEGKNGAKYLKLTISVNDEVDQYGNNVSCYEEQTKDEREAKVKRNYLGNGKVTWGGAAATKTEALTKSESTVAESDSLPF
jgi:hypothetical protein